MKRLLFWTAAALILAGCHLFDPLEDLHATGAQRPDPSPRSLVTPTTGIEQALRQRDTLIYVTGVEYPASYDWRRDSLDGQTACRLVVFVGQRRVLELPAGPGTKLSAEPDRHRIRGGHLYTDCPLGGEMVICRDGQELFRYAGTEALCGFQVSGEDVYTLGRPKDGKGFRYRKNGVLLFASDSGSVVGSPGDSAYPEGALLPDGDGWQFCYYEEGTPRRWYAFRGGRAEPLPLPAQEKAQVLDAKVVDGIPVMLYLPTPDSQQIRILRAGLSDGAVSLLARQILEGQVMPDGRHFKASYVNMEGRVHELFWGDSREDVFITAWDGTHIRAFYREGDRLAAVFCRDDVITRICLDGKYFPMEEAQFLWSSCACYKGGRFYAVLAPLQRHLSPTLWIDGQRLALNFYGYPTSVTVTIHE